MPSIVDSIFSPLAHSSRQASDAVDLGEFPLPAIIEGLLLLPMMGTAGLDDADGFAVPGDDEVC